MLKTLPIQTATKKRVSTTKLIFLSMKKTMKQFAAKQMSHTEMTQIQGGKYYCEFGNGGKIIGGADFGSAEEGENMRRRLGADYIGCYAYN
jgi:hypothetical protein